MPELVVLSFLAGVLTIAAPCILPLIPVIVGGSLLYEKESKKSLQSLRKPFVICLSLCVSIIIFTLILKATTALLGVPTQVWSIISGTIVILIGLTFTFPSLWESLMVKLNTQNLQFTLLSKQNNHSPVVKDIIVGASLGPIFNSCSPTYALIVATILPVSIANGVIYITAYAIGVSISLFMISIAGRSLVSKITWISNNHGAFKRSLGVVFLIVGLLVSFGLDKQAQSFILDRGWYAPVSNLEKSLAQ